MQNINILVDKFFVCLNQDYCVQGIFYFDKESDQGLEFLDLRARFGVAKRCGYFFICLFQFFFRTRACEAEMMLVSAMSPFGFCQAVLKRCNL